MKKFVSLILLGALMCGGMKAYAANVEVKDFVNGIIDVSGKTSVGNETVNILILSPGKTREEAENDSSLQQFSNSIVSDKNGNYSVSVKVKKGASGKFPIFIKEGGNEVEEKTLYFASVAEKINAADAIVNAENPSDKLSDSVIREILSVDSKLLEAIDLTKCDEMLKKMQEDDPLVFDPAHPENGANIEPLNELVRRIKVAALIECFNSDQKAAVFADGELLYPELMGVDTLSEKEGVNAYELFKNSLSDAGKDVVIECVMNENNGSLEELNKNFTKAVMYAGISYNELTGYSHVSDYINDKNVEFALGSTDELKDYLDLSQAQKSSANNEIIRNKSSVKYDNFISEINKIAKNVKTGNTQQGNDSNGGGSSSGSKGGNGASGFYAPAAEETKKGEEIAERVIFKDLENAQWAKEAIEFLFKKNIMSGVGDNKFAPSDKLTREQAAKIICGAFYISDVGEMGGFADVNENAWYAKYVYGAKNAGIIKGTDEDTFGVGMNITRQDLAVIIYRAMNVSEEAEEAEFADKDDIADYAVEAIAYLSGKGIINGYEDNTFRPRAFITRAEAAKLIYGILK